jgi:hypothetical protein
MKRAVVTGMLAIGVMLPGVLASVVLAPGEALGQPANTLRELSQALVQCAKIHVPPSGDEITLIFSLKRDGSLLGKPRITYSKLTGDRADQQEFVANTLSALSQCFPLHITDGLGGAIAGRPLSIRFIARPAPSAI